MPKFDVHIYAVVRVKVVNVDAADKFSAIQRVDNEINLYDELGRYTNREADEMHVDYHEFAEEITDYIVDPLDEDDEVIYEESRLIGADVFDCEMRVRGVEGY